jgi:hypothetical protein
MRHGGERQMVRGLVSQGTATANIVENRIDASPLMPRPATCSLPVIKADPDTQPW